MPGGEGRGNRALAAVGRGRQARCRRGLFGRKEMGAGEEVRSGMAWWRDQILPESSLPLTVWLMVMPVWP